MSRKRVQILLSIVLLGGSLTYLLSSTFSEAVEYYHPAAEVIAAPDAVKGQKIKIGGTVVKGSIFQKKGTLEYQFDVQPVPEEAARVQHMETLGKSVTVRYTGVVPDTFKDDAQVVVSGTLGEDHVFKGTDLTAKCPSKYEAADKNKGTY
jgi:cytochrome c-type biogenesis protein CcmE